MVERDSKGDFAAIRCDKCGLHAPPTSDLVINHGLIGMGWECHGGTHICPAHTLPSKPRA